jgi:hypothetical protein
MSRGGSCFNAQLPLATNKQTGSTMIQLMARLLAKNGSSPTGHEKNQDVDSC